MATFGAIPSSFGDPNQFYNPMAVDQAIRQNRHNDLLDEGLRQEIDDRTGNRAGLSAYVGTLGIGAPAASGPQTAATPAAPGSFEQRLGASEGGANPAAVNAGGYSGQFQMGKARMADLGYYKPAEGEDMKSPEWKGTVTVPGFNVTDQASFVKNPAAQHVVFGAHVGDIDQAIAGTPGADKLNKDGLRAVAHLGGVAGMQRFIATGGLYDPADANGTRLSQYYTKFAAGGAAALQKEFGSPHGPSGPGGGVAGRIPGAVDVAGPGAGPAPGYGPDGQPLAAGTWDASPVRPGQPAMAGPPDNAVGPAAPAAPPAAITAPAAPPQATQPTPGGLQLNPRNNMTPQQEQAVQFASHEPKMTQSKLAAMVDGYQKENAALIQQQRGNQRQTELDAATKAERDYQHGQDAAKAAREAVADKRLTDKDAREATAAGKDYQGSAIEAQDGNILNAGDDGTRRYAGAYARQATPKVNVDGSTTTPNMAAYDKPTFAGGKGVTGTPDYTKPVTTDPTRMNADQGKVATFADRMAEAHEVIGKVAAPGLFQRGLGFVPGGNFVASAGTQQYEQAQRNFINATLRRESGAAIQPSEYESANKQYFPQPGDGPEVLAQKKANREATIAGFVRESGPAYKPATKPTTAAHPPLPPGFKVDPK
jgi:hypothetical protein